MNKVFPYLGILCLLLLVSANAITSTIGDQNQCSCQTGADRDSDQPSVPSPVEEDVSEDDETSKLQSEYFDYAFQFIFLNQFFADYFLPSFHYGEIISPPPQA